MYPVIGENTINGTETERANDTIIAKTITPKLMMTEKTENSDNNRHSTTTVLNVSYNHSSTLFNQTSTIRMTTPAGT